MGTALGRFAQLLFVLTFTSFAGTAVQAGTGFEEDFAFWPGATYNSAIPTLEQVVGHKSGDRITSPRQVLDYFYALEAADPARVKVFEYATTWERRPLIYVAISSAENIANLDSHKANMHKLADPRTGSAREADQLIASMPIFTWLSYGVHGNEISSTDAAIMTAYHLLAATNDPRTAQILNQSVVFINPMQNADGRARFIQGFEMNEGLETDTDPLSAERDEAWPGGRTNHYLFDLNRDWIIQTQPETIGHIEAVLEWRPQVFVDAHEMGSNSTYFFAPDALPFNPHLAEDQKRNLELFGRNNARYFDQFGFDYFTRDIFDAFYPGYGASWPSYVGASAMTYEQASARGLAARRSDGSEFHYRETVRHHFVTSLSTAEVAVTNREKILRDYYDYGVTAINEGNTEGVRAFIIPAQKDQAAADRLAGLLSRHGIEVYRAREPFRANSVQYASGSYVVNLNQPAKRMARVLLDEHVPMNAEFIAEQERRRAKNIGDQIYDVTAWSLPVMMNVDIANSPRAVPVSDGFSAVEGEMILPGAVSNPNATVAYLVPWGDLSAARVLTHALRAGIKVKSSDQAFNMNGTEYPAGTLIIKVNENDENLSDWLVAKAEETGASIVGVNSSWVSAGPNFGSQNVVDMLPPKIAMAWSVGTSGYSAGNTRFVIERQFDYPVTVIKTDNFSYADLSRYQVLILPAASFFGGDYKSVFGERGIENIRGWVRKGGTLILLGSANRFATDPDVNFLAMQRERSFDTVDASGGEDSAMTDGTVIRDDQQYREIISGENEQPDSVAGVLVRATVDTEHWLGAGLKSTLNVLAAGSDIYTPLTLSEGVNVARFAPADNLLISGYMWEENRQQLAYKPFLVVQSSGNGQVIGFTQDPTVRAYLDGLNIALVNAIFRGAAHSYPNR